MKKTIFNAFCLLLSAVANAESLTSPDGRYEINVDGMNYTVKFEGRTIIGESRLGIDIDNSLIESALGIPNDNVAHWCDDMTLQNVSRTERDTTWTPLYGENSTIRDNYKSMTLHYAKGESAALPSSGKATKGKNTVDIYNDDPTLNTRTKVSSKTITIKSGKPITLPLQPIGGAALKFTPVK